MDDVQALRLGQTEQHSAAALAGLDKLAERAGRRVRSLLEPLLGVRPLVTVKPSDTVGYDLWSAMAPSFSSLNVYRLSPIKGAMLLKLDPSMICAVVDRFYGGGGGKQPFDRTEFTASEERIMERLTTGIMEALTGVWSEIVETDYALIARETDPQALAIAEPAEQMLVQTLEVKLSKEEVWTIEFMFPLGALRQLEPALAKAGPDEALMLDPLWRARLADQMRNIRLPARTVLARPSLNMDELISLKEGDVIPLSIARSLPLIVGNQVVAHGTIGEQNGHAAFRIEKMN